MKTKLSSPHLYHFTKELNTVKLILENGFRFSLLPEKLISDLNEQLLFGISFCDIPFHNSETHSNCYGDFAIGLSKSWGIENGITPVRYIHKTSPGTSDDYLQLKAYSNKIRLLSSKEKTSYPVLYLLMLKTLLDERTGKLNYNSDFSGFNQHHTEFAEFYDFLKGQNEQRAKLFTEYIGLLQYRVTELENELALRNILMRNYEEDFTCPVSKAQIENKILYDEREWRAFKPLELTESNMREKISETQLFLNQGFLPKEYNLKFTSDDIVSVVVNSEKDREYLQNNLPSSALVKFADIKSKVNLRGEYIESDC